MNWLFVLVIGALLGYVVLDIAQDGALDGSLYHMVRGQSVTGPSVNR